MGFRHWLGSLIAGEDTQAHADFDASEAEVAGLNFRNAIDSHLAWKTRLQAVINGTSKENLSVPTVSSDDQCVLGKWLHSTGKQRFGSYPDFNALVKEHAHFHVSAGHILDLAKKGKSAEALALVNAQDFRHESQKLVIKLADLYHKTQNT